MHFRPIGPGFSGRAGPDVSPDPLCVCKPTPILTTIRKVRVAARKTTLCLMAAE